MQIKYSGPEEDRSIISLENNVSSWEVGDKIVVASTSWNPAESETFKIIECSECSEFQVSVKIDTIFILITFIFSKGVQKKLVF